MRTAAELGSNTHTAGRRRGRGGRSLRRRARARPGRRVARGRARGGRLRRGRAAARLGPGGRQHLPARAPRPRHPCAPGLRPPGSSACFSSAELLAVRSMDGQVVPPSCHHWSLHASDVARAHMIADRRHRQKHGVRTGGESPDHALYNRTTNYKRKLGRGAGALDAGAEPGAVGARHKALKVEQQARAAAQLAHHAVDQRQRILVLRGAGPDV